MTVFHIWILLTITLSTVNGMCNLCGMLEKCLQYSSCAHYYYNLCKCGGPMPKEGKCGIAEATPRPRIATFIVGGDDVRNCELPWTVVLFRNDIVWCGGTLIDNIHVVTAAHCLANLRYKDELVVGYGSTDRRRTQNITVMSYTSHPMYSGDTNDIAILRLRYPVIFGKCVKPICLPSSNYMYTANKECLVAGWGLTNEATLYQPNHLQKVYVPLLDWDMCRGAYNNMQSTQLCAGYYQYGGKDACNTDSGGPLICQSSGRWTLIGVVSSGVGCARPGLPGKYTNVSKYISWIEIVTNSPRPSLYR